ncbi:hypothetical protein LFML04_0064 [Leptospirillum ferriphilum ML-04]|jgi:hypothetical protein|uniref:Uncharacterized protein n=1 Tax=Leptospirillum ferriphilum (strain ML-04) TaxID=1048260 RepID=J9Z9J4_LEPFM|nr:hypothetical protein LFML04_0064 [Leptospirillum ferriphilum ML-04]
MHFLENDRKDVIIRSGPDDWFSSQANPSKNFEKMDRIVFCSDKRLSGQSPVV